MVEISPYPTWQEENEQNSGKQAGMKNLRIVVVWENGRWLYEPLIRMRLPSHTHTALNGALDWSVFSICCEHGKRKHTWSKIPLLLIFWFPSLFCFLFCKDQLFSPPCETKKTNKENKSFVFLLTHTHTHKHTQTQRDKHKHAVKGFVFLLPPHTHTQHNNTQARTWRHTQARTWRQRSGCAPLWCKCVFGKLRSISTAPKRNHWWTCCGLNLWVLGEENKKSANHRKTREQ